MLSHLVNAWFIIQAVFGTSRFAAEGRRSLQPASFAAHALRKHLKTLISENTLISSGNQTNAHIHKIIFLLESNKVVYPRKKKTHV